jgi:hypothetical protein
MIKKSLDAISEEDLQAMIDNSVLEGKTIEYKQSLPGNSDTDKKEFLADVSSFANASGGDLIYGIVEGSDTGFPVRLEGLAIENVDQEIIRRDSMIRDGIEPRIPGIGIKAVNLSDSKVALVIRIPNSWISPHRVCYSGHNKFYSRSTNGKYQMDVTELRIAFTLSETAAERIRRFREDRIGKIFANETPFPFCETAKMVLHLIPLISFNPGQRYDLGEITSGLGKMPPLSCNSYNSRFNFDGFLTYCVSIDGKTASFVQLYKNGIIEAVDGLLLNPRLHGGLIIPSVTYEESLIGWLPSYISILKTLNVELPIFLFLTLIGVKGYSMGAMGVNRRILIKEADKPAACIDKEVLILPEIVIESYDVTAKDILRPCFDSIWNACGFPQSLNYNEAGDWVKK